MACLDVIRGLGHFLVRWLNTPIVVEQKCSFMDVKSDFERTSVILYKTARRHISNDGNLYLITHTNTCT